METALAKYVDIRFFLKFIVTFSVLFFFHQFFIGISTPGNYYNPFIDQHLNYVKWIISGVLHLSNGLAHLMGLASFVNGNYMVIENGASIDMGWACAGLGIMSFWIAFVTAHTIGWKKKLAWCLAGITAIVLLNCLRISLLLYALQHNWKESLYASHHDMFNYASFILIFLLAIVFIRKAGKMESSEV
jgi:exosortase/archaeosortase family protein